jgi:hypothetical protein
VWHLTLITAKQIINLLGSFWTRIFVSVVLVRQLIAGALSNHRQSEKAVEDLVASVSNLEIPAGKTTVWETFIFSIYSQQLEKYGDPTSKYGTSYFYGQVNDNDISYVIDEDILSIPFLYDNVAAPTEVYTQGIDYVLTPGVLKFKTIFSGTKTLYARNVVREAGFTTSRLGYAIDVQLADSVYQNVKFSDIWRTYTYGPTYMNLLGLLADAASGHVTRQAEVVQTLTYYGSTLRLITDKSVYYIPVAKAVPLKEGQVLPQGTSLTTSVEVLHDKDVYITSPAVPQIYVDGKTFKYGQASAKASSMVIIKADITGANSAALKILKNTMPSDIKVLVFTNSTVAPAELDGSNLSTDIDKAQAKITPPANLAAANISLVAKSRLKYTSYGY